ncbi:MAG: hypothetical protein M3461_01000 [Pseudomonadota bacterium]|nr:hypothetical protein [Pseudomonadota bacterium]
MELADECTNCVPLGVVSPPNKRMQRRPRSEFLIVEPVPFAAPLMRDVRWKEDIMAEYGEWNRKGATLSDVTAKAEYGVSQDFIVKGIQTGKLEYRQGSVWGNPYLRVLRSQLEKYIAEEFGEDYLLRVKNQTELRRVKKEISDLKKRLEGLQERKNELEALLGK